MKKITAAVLSIMFSLALLVGCGKVTPIEPGPKDVIYKSAPFTPKGESYAMLSGVAFDGNEIYLLVIATESGEDGAVDNTYLLKTDISGNVTNKTLLYSVSEKQTSDSNLVYYTGISIGDDGKVYLIRETVENSDNDNPGLEAEIVLRDGETETVLVDVSGKLSEAGVDAKSLYISDFVVDEDNIAYVLVGNDSYYAFDLTTGQIVNKSIPESIDIDSAQGDDMYEYYSYSNSAINGFHDGVGTLVADLTASGVNLTDITKLIPVSDTQFLLAGYTADIVGLEKLFMLTKVAPEDVPDKTIITVAAVSSDLYMPEYITKFTASHPEYQIEYKLYTEEMYVEGKAFDDALNALNTDLAAGNVPDVLLIDRRMNYGNYVRKGLFTDLYPLIDADPDYSREDFLKPFLSALETDGKLYSLAPAFSVDTLVGKTSIFGEKKGQSLEELEAAAAKIHGASLFGSPNRDFFTDSFLMRMYRRFVDEEKGVCSFESPEFISLLEYAKTLPPPAPDAEPYMSSTWWPDETGDYRENIALIQAGSFLTFRDAVAIEKMDYGEPITFLGFPNSSGGPGIQAYARLETAILVNAKNPDGAWVFVKGLQTFEHTDFHNHGYPPMWYFPVRVSELEIAAKNATIPAFQYDAITGERIPRVSWLGPNLSDLPLNTEADNAKMYTLFDSIENIRRNIPAIQDIIKEEIVSLYSGDKTPEETAAMIQNRATTYLEEAK
jgi:ABC-type glycerol-3-phosphate transport system substrate-binding protein